MEEGGREGVREGVEREHMGREEKGEREERKREKSVLWWQERQVDSYS